MFGTGSRTARGSCVRVSGPVATKSDVEDHSVIVEELEWITASGR